MVEDEISLLLGETALASEVLFEEGVVRKDLSCLWVVHVEVFIAGCLRCGRRYLLRMNRKRCVGYWPSTGQTQRETERITYVLDLTICGWTFGYNWRPRRSSVHCLRY